MRDAEEKKVIFSLPSSPSTSWQQGEEVIMGTNNTDKTLRESRRNLEHTGFEVTNRVICPPIHRSFDVSSF